MKSFLAALILGVCGQAFACPNLSGTYEVQEQDGIESLLISQSQAGNVTTYTLRISTSWSNSVATQIWFADGQPQTTYTPGNSSSYDVTRVDTASCSGEKLVDQFTETVVRHRDHRFVTKVSGVTKSWLDANGNLKQLESYAGSLETSVITLIRK